MVSAEQLKTSYLCNLQYEEELSRANPPFIMVMMSMIV